MCKIATDKMEGGEAIFDSLKKGRSGGMPWMVVLDGEGKEVVSSVGPEGNVGCPVSDGEIEHFVHMVKVSTDASDEHLAKITDAMKANAKKLGH